MGRPKGLTNVATRLLMWLFVALVPWLDSFDPFVERLTGISPLGYAPGARNVVQGLPRWVVCAIGAGGFLVTSLSAIRQRRRPARRAGTPIRAFNVLWEDTGLTDESNGHAVLSGPGCPQDETLLVFRDLIGTIRRPKESDVIGLNGRLFCPKCKTEYSLAANLVRIGDAREAIGRSLRGRRILVDQAASTTTPDPGSGA